jgi:hypothetical protein
MTVSAIQQYRRLAAVFVVAGVPSTDSLHLRLDLCSTTAIQPAGAPGSLARVGSWLPAWREQGWSSRDVDVAKVDVTAVTRDESGPGPICRTPRAAPHVYYVRSGCALRLRTVGLHPVRSVRLRRANQDQAANARTTVGWRRQGRDGRVARSRPQRRVESRRPC